MRAGNSSTPIGVSYVCSSIHCDEIMIILLILPEHFMRAEALQSFLLHCCDAVRILMHSRILSHFRSECSLKYIGPVVNAFLFASPMIFIYFGPLICIYELFKAMIFLQTYIIKAFQSSHCSFTRVFHSL